jgi:flagellar biosynthetic protein FliO
MTLTGSAVTQPAAPTEAPVSSIDGAPADSTRPSASTRRAGSTRRIATIACIAAIAGVALIGTLHPATAAGGAGPAASAPAASPSATSAFSLTDSGINWPDLIVKGTIVLVLLFITLRVLGRTGAGAPKRGGRLEVLESRPLAPKASLHLVAIGDRRLVVGLTPSGMVALAELDAAELETENATSTAPTADAAPVAAATFDFASLIGRRAPGVPAPTLGSALDTVLRPLDAVTGRVAGFLNGGRTR